MNNMHRSLRAKSRSASPTQPVSRLRSKRTVLGLALLVAGCGGKTELHPKAGESLPPKPYAAEATPTPSQLMTPEIQARPRRSDELLKQSEERRDDRFDLSPQ